MPYYCTVPRCTSMAGKAKNVSFHQFPRDEEMAKLWNNILKRGKPYTKYSKVCSLHFRAEDYTMTSVGKNKGQWRTLRKNAIPSCNLPSDSPTPQYQRRSSTGVMVGPTIPPNLMDPQIQQQMAQAIYVQTMLAMQAASFRDVDQPGTMDLSVRHNESPETEERLQDDPPTTPSQSAYRDVSELEEILLNYNSPKDLNTLATNKTETPTNSQENTSYKCLDCTKCFKDPDVYLLHKRSHRNAENISIGSSVIPQHQKENIDCNSERQENTIENLRQETLKANPILANLLRPDTVADLPSNGVSVENQLMTAMALNMQAYIRSLAQKGNFTETDSDVSESCDELNESKDSNRLVIDESV